MSWVSKEDKIVKLIRDDEWGYEIMAKSFKFENNLSKFTVSLVVKSFMS